MPDNPQPVRFYKKSATAKAGSPVPTDGARDPVWLVRHSAGFTAAMVVVMAGRLWLFERAVSDFDVFSAALVLLFWALLWSVLFSAGLAWAGVQRLPSFWLAFIAGAVTTLGFHGAHTLLLQGYGIGALPEGASLAGARTYVAAWMAGYSLITPALAGVVTARCWRARLARSGR